VKMKNLNLIKEEFIRLSDSPELFDLLKRFTAYFDEKGDKKFIEENPYAFVSYLDLSPKRLIACKMWKESECRQIQNLPDLLTSQNPNNFYKILYVSTFYQPLNEIFSTITGSPFTSCSAPRDEFLDGIFAESRGYLAYNYQLEMLYRMITGCAPLTAEKFRQGLFKKACKAWEEAGIIRFPNGKSLKKVMDERMLGEFTFSPNYHGAMNLYECCFK
jgi:hypothetical protein